MKMILFALGGVLLFVSVVNADSCEVASRTYACMEGYYLDGEECVRCPSSGGVYGTTVDQNTGDITSCYIPSDTSFSDDSGAGVYTGDCYYTN